VQNSHPNITTIIKTKNMEELGKLKQPQSKQSLRSKKSPNRSTLHLKLIFNFPVTLKCYLNVCQFG